jgi:hypothetical protein
MTPLDPAVDYLQFSDDSANVGKKAGYFKLTLPGGVVYIPSTLLVDDEGNPLDARMVNGHYALTTRDERIEGLLEELLEVTREMRTYLAAVAADSQSGNTGLLAHDTSD